MSATPPRPKARRKNVRGPHLYRRGQVWYAYLPARPDGVSLHTRDAKEAARKLPALVGGEGSDPRGLPGEAPFAQIVSEWEDAPHGYTTATLRSARIRASTWLEWLAAHGVTLASEITLSTLDTWLSERTPVVSRRTINRDLRTLRVVLRWAAARALCSSCAVVERHPGLREADWSARAVIPSPGEIALMLAALHGRHRTVAAAVRVLYATGLRVSELRRLAVGDLHDGAVWVRPEHGPADSAEPTKGYRERSIPLGRPAQELVTAWLARVARRGRAPSSRTIHRQIVAACAEAEVTPCGVHDLRRAAATEWARAGVAVTVISGWLGHRLVRTTERYLGTYRSDALVRAPLPSALTAEKVPKATGVQGHSGSEVGSAEGRGRRSKKA